MRSIVKTGKSIDEAVNEALMELSVSLEEVDIEILEEAKSGFLGIIGSKNAVVRVSLKGDEFEDLMEDIPNNMEEDLPETKKSKKEESPKKDPKEGNQKNREEKKKRNQEEKKQEITIEKEVSTEQSAISDKQVQDDIEENDEIEEKVEIKTEDSKDDRIEEEDPEEEQDASPLEQDLEDNEVQIKAREWMEDLLVKMHIDGQINMNLQEENIYIEVDHLTDSDTGILIGRRAETLDAIQYLLGIYINREAQKRYRVFVDAGGYRKRKRDNLEKMVDRLADRVLKNKKMTKLEPMNAYERRLVHTYLQGKEGIETFSEGKEPFRRVVIKAKK